MHIAVLAFQGLGQQLTEHSLETIEPAQRPERKFLGKRALTRIVEPRKLRSQQPAQRVAVIHDPVNQQRGYKTRLTQSPRGCFHNASSLEQVQPQTALTPEPLRQRNAHSETLQR